MARKSIRCLLLCSVSLAFLPGCQLFSSLAGVKTEVARSPQNNDGKLVPSDVPASKKPAPTAPDTNGEIHQGLRPTDQLNEPKPIARSTEPIPLAKTSFTADPPAKPPAQAREASNLLPQEEAVLQAMRCIFEGRNPDAIEHLQVFTPDTQDILLRMLPAMVILVKTPIDKLSTQQIAALDDQLVWLLKTLRPRSELIINNMCYCRNYKGFGVFEFVPENHAFLAGSSDGTRMGERVQVYVELKNFASEPAPGGVFVTKLPCRLEIYDATHKLVKVIPYSSEETTHVSKTRLNDFSRNYSFYVPALAPGAYELKIQIADETVPELRRRVASKSLDFRVTPVVGQ